MITRRNLFKSAASVGAAAALSTVAIPAVADTMGGRKGSFKGLSNHVTTGTAHIVEEDGRRFVVLGDDFSLDGGPDPRVALGKDGTYDPDTLLGALLDLNGKQRYAVPPTWNIADHNEVYIWCEVAGVPLGVAEVM